MLLAGAGPAAATPGDPDPGISAIDQYVEAIPTSSGPAPTGRVGAARPLPHRIVSQVREQGGDDAEALLKVATSPTYGAPPKARPADRVRARDVGESPAQPNPFDAVVTPIADADEPRLLVLLSLIGGMTLAAFALATRRQRA